MMKKDISYLAIGQRADIGEYIINRILPNQFVGAVGPFVFLDHVLPVEHSPNAPRRLVNGKTAHPHRSIATLTYILNGEGEHYDSNENHAIVNSGGAQWMKAGNGVIHDEVLNFDPQKNNFITHAFQFWINLPSVQKAEQPQYVPIQADEVPQQALSDQSGWIKVLVGKYGNLVSKIPNYSTQFLYHIHIEAGKRYVLEPEIGLESAIYLPLHEAIVNGSKFQPGALTGFIPGQGTIEIDNTQSTIGIDVIVFGGERYTEPIVSSGPFVMNSEKEIAEAYSDFHEGKYGVITYI
jgi:redox-sensitive bicupin YhaK (pirin superfamily)